MKTKLRYFLILLLLCGSVLVTNAQTANLYAKGNFFMTLNQQLDFKFLSVKSEGEKIHNVYKSHVNVWGCYFLANHLALDVGYYHTKESIKNGTNFTDGTDKVYLGLLYGGSVGDFNLQGFATVGLGASRYQYMEDYTEKDKDIELLVGIESPINISGACNGLLTPRIGFNYGHSTWKGEEGNEMENPGGKCNSTGIYFDLDLTLFIPGKDFSGDFRDKCANSVGTYDKGRNMFGIKSMMHLKFGGAKTDYDETDGSYSMDYKNNFSDFDLDALYYYYLIKDLAIGFDFGLRFAGDKFKDSDTKYTSRKFMIMPGVMYNLPVDGCLNNLFVNAGIGYGLERNKNNYGSSETTSGNNIFAWNLGAGYNYFFTKYLSLTPRISYDWQSYKPTDSGDSGTDSQKYTEAGVVLSFGLSYFFNSGHEATRFIE